MKSRSSLGQPSSLWMLIIMVVLLLFKSRNTEVSSVPLSFDTKLCNITCHLILSFSSLKAACQNELVLSIDVLLKCLLRSVKLFFSWSSVLKAALHINSGGCPLSFTFNLSGICLSRWSSVEGCAGRNLVFTVKQPSILNGK